MSKFGKYTTRRYLALGITALGIGVPTAIGWTGLASRYDEVGLTASGDYVYADSWTAAHRTFPMGSELTVCRAGWCAHNVVVNDYGPATWTGNDLDLHSAVADSLGIDRYIGEDYVRYHREIGGHWDGIYMTRAGKWLTY